MSWGQTKVTSLTVVSSLLLLQFKEPFADVQGYFPARERQAITFVLRKWTFLYIYLIHISGYAACMLSQCKK